MPTISKSRVEAVTGAVFFADDLQATVTDTSTAATSDMSTAVSTSTITGSGTTVGASSSTSTAVSAVGIPSPLVSNGVLYGGNGALAFTEAPTVPSTALVWNGSAFQWQYIPASPGSVSYVAAVGGDGMSVSGGPVTSRGTFTVSLVASGVTAGSYGLFSVDQYGRMTSAASLTSTAVLGVLGYQPIKTVNSLVPDASGNVVVGLPVTRAYDIAGGFPGVPPANLPLFRLVMVRAVTFAAQFAGSNAVCIAPPSAAISLPIYRNGIQIGALTYAAGATVGAFSTTSTAAMVLGVDEVLEMTAPLSVDQTFSGPSYTICGTIPFAS